PPGVALTAMVTNSARVTRLDRFMFPFWSPAMMPRAWTTWVASATGTGAAEAASAGAAREQDRQAASRAVRIRFFIFDKTPLMEKFRGAGLAPPPGFLVVFHGGGKSPPCRSVVAQRV